MLALPARLLPAPEASRLAARLARRGGRAFLLDGERVLTMPGAEGVEVLVPRGFGHPLLARTVGGVTRALGTGAPCLPARWVSAGGVAARVREVPLPRGPSRALPVEEPAAADADGLWLVVRTEALAWAAARLADPSVTHGAVAVVERKAGGTPASTSGVGARVRGVSAGAARLGVAVGTTLALARRRCARLRVVEATGVGELGDAVERLLAAVGPVARVAGGWRVRLPSGDAIAAGERAERALRQLWQRAGVEAAAAVAARVEDAAGLARVLAPGQVGVVPADAAGAWSARDRSGGGWWVGRRGASWRGAALPDLDGAIARARGLAAALARAGTLRFTLAGERGEIRVDVVLPAGCEPALRDALLDAGLRGRFASFGAVTAMRIDVVGRPAPREAFAPVAVEAPAPRQLALLPGMR